MRAFLTSMGSVLASIVVLASSQGCSSSSSDASASAADASAGDAALQGDAPATGEGGAEAGSASPDFRSGSRLRAMTYVAAGGTKLFTGFFDSELKQRCTFATADDGSMRCLPEPTGTVVFTDAACAKPVLLFDDPCADAPLPYTRLADATTECLPKTATYAIGAATPAPASTFTRGGDGKCTAQTPGATPPKGYYALTQSPATKLVAATEAREARGDRLDAVIVHAEDGALATIDMSDRTRFGRCEVRSGGIPGTADRCMPTSLAYEEERTFNSDATCMTAIAYKSSAGDACATPPSAVWRYAKNMCAGYDVTLAEPGAEVKGTVYSANGMTCDILDRSLNGGSYFAVGAPLAATTLAKLGTADVGSARIQVRYATAESGEMLLAQTFFDSTRKEACSARTAGDGALRCMPAVFDSNQMFADAACTIPVANVYAPPACAAPPIPALVSTSPAPATACGIYKYRIFKVDPTKPVTNVYFFNGNVTCEPGTPQPSTTYYDASVEVASSEFAELTSVTE